MREITEWWAEIVGTDRCWLILGKGPSFGLRDRYDLGGYATIGVNHVVREMPVFAASAVNHDVLRECGEAVYRNARYLLMPYYPHSLPGPAHGPVEAHFPTFPVLEALEREGRLVCYNLSSDPIVPGSPVIENGPYSVCILFNLLGMLGARHLRTLGVDGGSAYAPAFGAESARQRLAAGLTPFDDQFLHLAAAVQRYGLDYAPLAGLTPGLHARLLLYRGRYFLRAYGGRYVKQLLARARRARAATGLSALALLSYCPWDLLPWDVAG